MSDTAFETTRPDDYMLRVAASDVGRGFKAAALEELRLRPGLRVLDLGCGPGADLPEFAAAVGPEGRVVGIDRDAEALATAAARTAELAQVELHHGDIHALPLGGRSVDRIHTDRVLQHVESLLDVLTEARRVIADDGRAVFVEPDWDTLVIDSADSDTFHDYRRFVTERVVRNSFVGRQLPGVAESTGWHVETVRPITAVYRGLREADAVLGFHRVAMRAVEYGYLSGPQAHAWLHGLGTRPFFASVTLFILVATPAPGGAQ
ncbi:hypothetical protein AX769_12485 [Frondihabitans sp. PAMC 28766]|uniref:methyltransferase domain-containing protein n=1 Tax=Frondihabitans sp. PAMC 28766 TaxID=1795630 RepID=UPI00078BB4FB|nr:methyltransferase domain-containing protein [Frondihabitans sp. PAMC 28766]AMM20808.1 hypothetical protein AX769_12485 [Frondihabitans sp. PAMC 28766]